MHIDLPLLAGVVSSTIFTLGMVPMLLKAFQTKDLTSYSLSNLVLNNVGNLIHSVYVYSLPPGPIWGLHTFHLITMALMLTWRLHYGAQNRSSQGTAQSGAEGNGAFLPTWHLLVLQVLYRRLKWSMSIGTPRKAGQHEQRIGPRDRSGAGRTERWASLQGGACDWC